MVSGGQRALLVVLSLLSVGCVMGALLASVVMFIRYNLVRVNLTLFVFVLVALVVSLLLFIFAIYASFHQKRGLRVSVIIVFLLFDLGIIGLGSYALSLRSSVLPWLRDVWNKDDPTQAELKYIEALEDGFDCCGWSTYRPECDTSDDVSLCETTISTVYKRYFTPAAATLVSFGAVLVIASIIACRIVCTTKPDNDKDDSLGEPLVGSSHSTARTTHFNNYTW
jgi:hypothetical protein